MRPTSALNISVITFTQVFWVSEFINHVNCYKDVIAFEGTKKNNQFLR